MANKNEEYRRPAEKNDKNWRIDNLTFEQLSERKTKTNGGPQVKGKLIFSTDLDEGVTIKVMNGGTGQER